MHSNAARMTKRSNKRRPCSGGATRGESCADAIAVIDVMAIEFCLNQHPFKNKRVRHPEPIFGRRDEK